MAKRAPIIQEDTQFRGRPEQSGGRHGAKKMLNSQKCSKQSGGYRTSRMARIILEITKQPGGHRLTWHLPGKHQIPEG